MASRAQNPFSYIKAENQVRKKRIQQKYRKNQLTTIWIRENATQKQKRMANNYQVLRLLALIYRMLVLNQKTNFSNELYPTFIFDLYNNKHFSMYKTKIIQKNYKTRERLRAERGLQRDFTTYLMPPNLQVSETLSDLEQISSSTPSNQDYIILQQTLCMNQTFINPYLCYQIDYDNEEQIILEEKDSFFEEMNNKYLSNLCIDDPKQVIPEQKIKFDLISKVKSYSQEESVTQIKFITEKLQAVKFQD